MQSKYLDYKKAVQTKLFDKTIDRDLHKVLEMQEFTFKTIVLVADTR